MCALLLAPAFVLLVSCSGDDGADGGSGGGEETAAPQEQCDLLTDDQLATLTGGEVDGGPRTTDLQGIPACVWDAGDGATVQVADVEAGAWATALPDLVAQVQSSGAIDDPEQLQKLRDAQSLIESGSSVPDDEACDLFSTLVEIQGLGPDQDRVVNVVPTAEDPQGYSAQSCTDGRFSSVLLQAPGLTGSQAEADRVEAALDAVLAARH